MLAAGAYALLARDRPLVVAPFQALKHALELHHAGIGEQEGGVVRGNQRRAGHIAMTACLEELEELASDCGGLHALNIARQTAQLKGRIGLKRCGLPPRRGRGARYPRGILSGWRLNCAAMY